MKTLKKIQKENKNFIMDALVDSGIPLKTREIFTLEKVFIALSNQFAGTLVITEFGSMTELGLYDTRKLFKWDFLALDTKGFNTLEAQSEEFQRKFNELLGG